jgi:hypothetical protein
MNRSQPQLDGLERWMLAAITDPAGVAASEVSRVILPSLQQSSAQRLAVYQSAYFARLLEVLRELFPCTRFAVGEELFDPFAAGYLQAHPPHGYTLARLADKLVDYLDATRPSDWGAFVVELARLEQAIDRIFDGAGPEGLPPFELPAGAGGGSSLVFVPGLELHAFSFPVSTYYTGWKAGRQPAWPSADQQYVALFRREYVVRRLELTAVQYELLLCLKRGSSIDESLATAGALDTLSPEEVQGWFAQWARCGFFAGVK